MKAIKAILAVALLSLATPVFSATLCEEINEEVSKVSWPVRIDKNTMATTSYCENDILYTVYLVKDKKVADEMRSFSIKERAAFSAIVCKDPNTTAFHKLGIGLEYTYHHPRTLEVINTVICDSKKRI